MSQSILLDSSISIPSYYSIYRAHHAQWLGGRDTMQFGVSSVEAGIFSIELQSSYEFLCNSYIDDIKKTKFKGDEVPSYNVLGSTQEPKSRCEIIIGDYTVAGSLFDSLYAYNATVSRTFGLSKMTDSKTIELEDDPDDPIVAKRVLVYNQSYDRGYFFMTFTWAEPPLNYV